MVESTIIYPQSYYTRILGFCGEVSEMKKTLSENNPCHLSRNRQKELEYFVKQYPEWKEKLKEIDGYLSKHESVINTVRQATDFSSIIDYMVEERERYLKKIDLVDNTIDSLPICGILKGDILHCVITNDGYDKMCARKRIPCGRRQFYEYIRLFYFKLDRTNS